MSGGIYVLSLLVDDTMSNPSNIKSSSGGAPRLVRKCHGIKHVILGAAALLSSSLSSSLSVVVCVGVCLGAGAGGGVQ